MDCEWADWASWTGCKKDPDCGVTGGGQTERTKEISVEAMHGGTECEADILEDLMRCCAVQTTDATCPADTTCPGMKTIGQIQIKAPIHCLSTLSKCSFGCISSCFT